MEITRRVDSRKLSFDAWLSAISVRDDSVQLIRQWAKQEDFKLADGQHMVEILLDLNMDDETLLAAFSLPTSLIMGLEQENTVKRFGQGVVDLQQAAMRMDAIKALQGGSKGKLGEGQVDMSFAEIHFVDVIVEIMGFLVR